MGDIRSIVKKYKGDEGVVLTTVLCLALTGFCFLATLNDDMAAWVAKAFNPGERGIVLLDCWFLLAVTVAFPFMTCLMPLPWKNTAGQKIYTPTVIQRSLERMETQLREAYFAGTQRLATPEQREKFIAIAGTAQAETQILAPKIRVKGGGAYILAVGTQANGQPVTAADAVLAVKAKT